LKKRKKTNTGKKKLEEGSVSVASGAGAGDQKKNIVTLRELKKPEESTLKKG